MSDENVYEEQLKNVLATHAKNIIDMSISRLLDILSQKTTKDSDAISAAVALNNIVLKKLIADRKISNNSAMASAKAVAEAYEKIANKHIKENELKLAEDLIQAGDSNIKRFAR